jgi:isopentenyl phosphate kinase (EC 2.7.4.-)
MTTAKDHGDPETTEMPELVVLKLGGSVITNKDRPETLNSAALETAASTIARRLDGSLRRLVVIHGGGSFGHHHASAHGVTTDSGTSQPNAILDIHGAMTTLNRFVLDRLHAEGVPALPVHPLSVAARASGGELTMPVAAARGMLREGFVPVLHGDGVVHDGEGVTVLSGDELVVSLADELGAGRVGICSTVPGVLDGDEVIPEIASFEAVADLLGESRSTDVSGGMAGKVRQLLSLDAPAQVFGPDRLDAFLAGQRPGTRVK